MAYRIEKVLLSSAESRDFDGLREDSILAQNSKTLFCKISARFEPRALQSTRKGLAFACQERCGHYTEV